MDSTRKEEFMNVLIVDDVAFMRLYLKNMLEKRGYKIVGEARNGAEAIKKYIAFKPDLVTLDVNMPVMDGIQALKRIRQINKDAKIIMVTGKSDEEIVTESILAGANGFVVKPVNEDCLHKALKKII